MSAGLFQSAILSTTEAFINRLLGLDAAAVAKLKKLSGKRLHINCEFPAISCNLVISDSSIMLLQGDGSHADAKVSGKASGLARLLLTNTDNKLHDAGVVISGDTAFLADLQQILKGLDVDWEYRLSRIIGDIPTQAISDSISGTVRFSKRASSNLRDDIDAWLHEEKNLFPARSQLQAFYSAVDNLRLRVDRLEARTRKLKAR